MKVNMLYIHFGALPAQLSDPDIFFNNHMRPEWFEDPFVKHICLAVDGTTVHSAYQMENPTFGPINCRILSMSCKNTILAYKTDKIIPATFMGNNCAPLVFEISKHKDLTITLEYLMDFGNCENFEAYIMNTDKIIHSYRDYVLEVVDLI